MPCSVVITRRSSEVGAVGGGFLKERQAVDTFLICNADEDILIGGLAEFESQAAIGALGSECESGEGADG